MPNLINSIHVKGFRSLADVEIDDLPRVAVLIGANGSGKSNIIRFFEMMSWMLGAHRLGEFIQRQGGADGGVSVPRHIRCLAFQKEVGRERQ